MKACRDTLSNDAVEEEPVETMPRSALLSAPKASGEDGKIPHMRLKRVTGRDLTIIPRLWPG